MADFRNALPQWLEDHAQAVIDRLETNRKLEDDDRAELVRVLGALADTFKPEPAT